MAHAAKPALAADRTRKGCAVWKSVVTESVVAVLVFIAVLTTHLYLSGK